MKYRNSHSSLLKTCYSRSHSILTFSSKNMMFLVQTWTKMSPGFVQLTIVQCFRLKLTFWARTKYIGSHFDVNWVQFGSRSFGGNQTLAIVVSVKTLLVGNSKAGNWRFNCKFRHFGNTRPGVRGHRKLATQILYTEFQCNIQGRNFSNETTRSHIKWWDDLCVGWIGEIEFLQRCTSWELNQ